MRNPQLSHNYSFDNWGSYLFLAFRNKLFCSHKGNIQISKTFLIPCNYEVCFS